MDDIEIRLVDEPGALAAMGEALGAAGISVEGGGAWAVAGVGVAHFLVADGMAAAAALRAAGIEVVRVRAVVVQRLVQDAPGQLGAFTAMLRDEGVNIEVLYSDHNNQLVVVADDHDRALAVSRAWTDRRRQD
ncbi:amino acid-binding ACT domain-containing protein [Euzebya tangerina]|uniref:amino acid-binding ACT domain-containing protein n=1 Tax=Euzebya tangerina TaxID=591198 RepID=UPI000E316F9C|nr:amino acid-binding ACT domain-containing protein [Euzebya tangerina]